MFNQAKSLSATGDFTAAAGFLFSVNLTAAAATALAVITDKATGTEICRLSATANTSIERQYVGGVAHGGLTCTLTGAGAICDAEF